MLFSEDFLNKFVSGGATEAYGYTSGANNQDITLVVVDDSVAIPDVNSNFTINSGDKLFESSTINSSPMVIGSPTNGEVALIGNWSDTAPNSGTPGWFALYRVGPSAVIIGTIPNDLIMDSVTAGDSITIPEIKIQIGAGIQVTSSGTFA